MAPDLDPGFSPQCLQNPSSDIRLVAEKMIWWANKDQLPPLDPQAIKPILKALLDNTKDKNTVVRAYSDQAIVNLLKLRQGEEVFQVGAWEGQGCWQGGRITPFPVHPREWRNRCRISSPVSMSCATQATFSSSSCKITP